MSLQPQSTLQWDLNNIQWENAQILWMPSSPYENLVFDNILDKLHTILADEFAIPVYFDEHRGNQSFLIDLLSDNLAQSFTSGELREYIINIEHQLVYSGTYHKNQVKQMSEIYERVKRLLHSNINNNDNWFHGRIESMSTTKDDNALLSAMQFNCVSSN